MQQFQVKISERAPSNKETWDKLCFNQGNLLQSTLYDKVQAYFNLTPIYLEIVRENEIIGGVKLFYYCSNKLPWLYKQITLFGEPVIPQHINASESQLLLNLLAIEINKLITEKQIVLFSQKSFYGGSTVAINQTKPNAFRIAHIDLLQDENSFLENMHAKHRNMINKAQKSELIFEQSEDIQLFLFLMEETYKNQEKEPPNKHYIEHLYKILSLHKSVALYFVKNKEGQYLSGALVQTNGIIADYLFGGNVKNNLGSGQYLHYKIFSELKRKGFSKYILGQVSDHLNINNLKFSEGITKFKKRFGVIEEQGFSIDYINKPINYKIWKLLISFFNKIKNQSAGN